ncbi:MAG: hypothetical protein ACI4V5_07855 [Prevotella sp.]
MRLNKYHKIIAVILLLTITSVLTIVAKNKQYPKVYMYGIAASFNDSTVYFTDIQAVDSVWINAKNKFLINRSDYSYQLKTYLENEGLPHRTCIVTYALKRKNLEKKYQKTRNRYVKKGRTELKYINKNEFSFKGVSLDE